jgi:large subunit ribosomal protein L16
MLIPKKVKYRKAHRARGTQFGVATKNFLLSYGTIGLKSMEGGEITSRQIEAARRTMSRATKRGGKIWIKIFPQKPITRKAAEVPMGSGKGSLDHYVAEIKAGTVMFEMGGLPIEDARKALGLAAHKLPVKCRIITNEL